MARTFRATKPTDDVGWTRMFSHLEDAYDFGFDDDEPFVATTPLDAGGAARWLHAAKTRQRSRAFHENRHRAQYHDYLGRRPKLPDEIDIDTTIASAPEEYDAIEESGIGSICAEWRGCVTAFPLDRLHPHMHPQIRASEHRYLHGAHPAGELIVDGHACSRRDHTAKLLMAAESLAVENARLRQHNLVCRRALDYAARDVQTWKDRATTMWGTASRRQHAASLPTAPGAAAHEAGVVRAEQASEAEGCSVVPRLTLEAGHLGVGLGSRSGSNL